MKDNLSGGVESRHAVERRSQTPEKSEAPSVPEKPIRKDVEISRTNASGGARRHEDRSAGSVEDSGSSAPPAQKPIIHDEFDQLSDQWLQAHVGRPTASEFHQFMTPTFEVRKGEMFTSYVCRKVAEKWRGRPLSGFSTFQTEQGMLREDEALPWLMLEYDQEIRRVGFVEGADGRCGCSPDGLIEPDGGCEIKCPEPQTHVRYLLANEVPKDYLCQVHGSLYVTGRAWWQFVSYAVKFPKLVLTVQRDEEIMKKIGKALAAFYTAFDLALDYLKERK